MKVLGSSGVAGRVKETLEASVLFRMVLHLRNFSSPGVDGADSRSHSLRAGDKGSVMNVIVLRIPFDRPVATRAGDMRWKGLISWSSCCCWWGNPPFGSILRLAKAKRVDG